MPNALTKVTGNVIDSATNITIGIGSTSGPSLSPNGDSNTGIFFPSADTIAFAEGGVEAARIDSSGNLGVGVTSISFSQFGSNTGGVAIADIGATNTGLKISDGSYHNYLVQAGNSNFYISHYGASGDIIVGVGSAGEERARFNSTGAFVLAGGATGANGIGIAFPATQSASTNANTLDDYEEGTWTASIATESGTAWTVTTQNSTYIKIGRMVFLHALINYTAKGSAQLSLVQSLPFTSTSEVTLYGYNYRSSDNTLRAMLFTAYSNYGVLLKWIDSGSFVNYFTSTSEFAAAGIIYVAGCYLAAS